MLTALLVMSAIALLLGTVLGFAKFKFKVEGNTVHLMPMCNKPFALSRCVAPYRRVARGTSILRYATLLRTNGG